MPLLMSCPLRIQFPGAVFHGMNRAAASQPTFADDRDCQPLLDILNGAAIESRETFPLDSVAQRVDRGVRADAARYMPHPFTHLAFPSNSIV